MQIGQADSFYVPLGPQTVCGLLFFCSTCEMDILPERDANQWNGVTVERTNGTIGAEL